MVKTKQKPARPASKGKKKSVRKRAQALSACCEAIFARTKHLHGLTKTAAPLVRAAAKAAAGLAVPLDDFPPHERQIVVRAVRVAAHPQLVGESTAPPTESAEAQAAIAARIGAIVRLAQSLEQAVGSAPRFTSICDDGRSVVFYLKGDCKAGKNGAPIHVDADLWNRVAFRPIGAAMSCAKTPLSFTQLTPDEPLAEVGRRLFQQQLEQLLSRQFGVAFADDSEYVHEIRVASRRLRAAMRVFRKAFAGDLIEESELIHTVTDAFGEARDTDVFLAFLQKYQKNNAKHGDRFLDGAIREQARRRRAHYRQLIKRVQSPEFSSPLAVLYERIGAELDAAFALKATKAGAEPILARAPKMVRRRLKQTVAFGRQLESLPGEAQHQLRITCKKLRYTAEFFRDLFPARFERLVDAATDLQELLGQMHDIDVYLDRLAAHFSARYGKRPNAAVAASWKQLQADLKRTRKQAAGQAARRWRQFVAPRNLAAIQRLLSL